MEYLSSCEIEQVPSPRRVRVPATRHLRCDVFAGLREHELIVIGNHGVMLVDHFRRAVAAELGDSNSRCFGQFQANGTGW